MSAVAFYNYYVQRRAKSDEAKAAKARAEAAKPVETKDAAKPEAKDDAPAKA